MCVQHVINCTVACLQPLWTFTELGLAAYYASVVKSNFGNLRDINPFYPLGCAPDNHGRPETPRFDVLFATSIWASVNATSQPRRITF